jgi:hypothetical protein
MALYVSAQNQKLLWDVLHKNQLIGQVFPNPSQQRQKEEWFKSVIQLFYEQNKYRNIKVRDLNDLNRETLIYMTTKLREYLAPQVQTNTNPQQKANISISTPPIVPDNRQDFFNQQFSARQREYEQMNEKKVPESIEFADKLDDEPISNMDELIRNHMQMRENELKQYAPPPPLPSTGPTTGPSVESIKIDNKSNVILEAVDIEEAKAKKKVRWTNEANHNQSISESTHEELDDKRHQKQIETNNSNDEIETFKAFMIEMSSKIEIIMMEIENIKTNINAKAETT